MISNLIALPYELARKPLDLADQRLSGRLPEMVGSRVGLALGSADKLAGTVLRKPALAQAGTDRVEQATKLLTATRLERKADAGRKQARQIEADGRLEATVKREAAQERAVTGFDEADKAEARGKQEAKERADKLAESKQTAADKRAVSRKQSAQRRKEQVTSVAEAKQKTAQHRSKVELDEAHKDEQAADAAHADAERLSELTHAKKQARKPN